MDEGSSDAGDSDAGDSDPDILEEDRQITLDDHESIASDLDEKLGEEEAAADEAKPTKHKVQKRRTV